MTYSHLSARLDRLRGAITGTIEPQALQDAEDYLTLLFQRLGLPDEPRAPQKTRANATWQDWMDEYWPGAESGDRHALWNMWCRAILIGRLKERETPKPSSSSDANNSIETEHDFDRLLLASAKQQTAKGEIGEWLMELLLARGLMSHDESDEDPRACLTQRGAALIRGAA